MKTPHELGVPLADITSLLLCPPVSQTLNMCHVSSGAHWLIYLFKVWQQQQQQQQRNNPKQLGTVAQAALGFGVQFG